jgi:diadenosine tetraphosphate (Ap4A) HIT family hydrolase
MCTTVGAGDTPFGISLWSGRFTQSYLGRRPPRRGYCFVVWTGRHVAEPTELDPEEAAGYWSETLAVCRAIEAHYSPLKMNISLLGNGVPHLHAHLVPRYREDPAAGGPMALEDWRFDDLDPEDPEVLEADAASLRALLEAQSDIERAP